MHGHAFTNTDERLLVELAQADPNAFAELYRRYLPRVHAFAYRRTGAQEVAEDITSAAFERALRNLHLFTWQAGGFAPWLFRIVANELADHYRRAGRAGSERVLGAAAGMMAVAPADPADVVMDRADARHLLATMDGLSPRYQQALSLRYLSGLSPEDAARALGTNRTTFAVVLHRATSALRKALREGSES